MTRIGPFAIAVMLLGAAAASAQLREQITVESVDVPVYVISKGKPVGNLSKDDFELYVNGKPQPIDYFEAVNLAAPPPAAAAAASPEETPVAPHAELRDRRLFLLLFDVMLKHLEAAAIYVSALDRSRRAALNMVDHALPNDLFAVAAVTYGGIKFVSPFLRDHDAIRRAILQLEPSRAQDGLAISITSSERAMAGTWTSSPLAAGKGGGENPLPDLLTAASALQRDREERLANDQIEWYTELAARLRGLDGLKHVIFFSDGQPALFEKQFKNVTAMASSFQGADAYLHAVDLTPMATGSDPSVMTTPDRSPQPRPSENSELLGDPYTDWFAPKEGVIAPSENEWLFWMSHETGGSWIHWKNKLTPALEDLSASYSAFYRLGFKPAGARKGHNDIEVKVKNLPAGARVSFRRGFSTAVPAKGTAPDPFLLADIIQNDTPQSGTPPAISVANGSVNVIVPVILLSSQFGAVDGAKAMLYVFDAKGVPVVSTEKTFAIPANPARDRVIQQKLDLAPGKYIAKVLLRVGDSLSFAKEPFEIGSDQPYH